MGNTPEIRFKGFTDDWEQRKLGEVTQEFKSGNALKSDEISITGKYPVYGGNGLRGYTLNYNHDGEFALIGRQGALCGNMNYSAGKAYFTEHAVVVEADSNNNTRFLYYMLNTMNLGQYSDQSAQPGLAVNKLIKLKNFFPEKSEQIKIGAYFSNLDHLITLHQRKCDETKKLKKYMLQKMFPQKGEKNPEIRFAGFTDDWEQRKVTELGEIYIGLVTTMTAHYTNEGTLLIRNSDIKDGKFAFDTEPIYLDKEFAEQNKSRKHKIGDVITVHTGDVGTSAVIAENEANSIGFATIVTRPNKELLDSYYLATFLNTEKHKTWAVQMSTGDGRTNYNLRDYTELVIPVPKLEEQKKIANCISNLNTLITLHQCELEKLKNFKKFMLRKMFV